MNRGFTLIELIGTVVILAVISLIAFPAILNMLNSSNKELEDQTKEFINSAALDYVKDHTDDFSAGSTGSVSVQELMNGGYISTSVICDDCEIYNDTISVKRNGDKYDLKYNEVGGGTCPNECS